MQKVTFRSWYSYCEKRDVPKQRELLSRDNLHSRCRNI